MWEQAGVRVIRASLRTFQIDDLRRQDREWELTWHPIVLVVAVSSSGLPDDVQRRPFAADLATHLEQRSQAFPPMPFDALGVFQFIDQESHEWTAMHSHRGWTVLLHRDGAAAVGWHHEVNAMDKPTLPGIQGTLRTAWEEAVRLHVERIGGSGRGRLRVLASALFGVDRDFYVDRTIELRAPADDEVESVAREIRRATGDPLALEPEPS